ncbi:MAG TPA: efflux RND transporter periplasmic adaptor subunit [Xanthobacteraceae bacterium]|jgi:multidrug efflux pump subunit AcrA (membrane-fusion protein)
MNRVGWGLAALVAAALGCAALCGSAAGAAENGGAAPVQVSVIRVTQEWFAAEIRVTGFLVPREEAVVTLDPGYRVSEVVAGEGDRVSAGQTLARLTRQAAAMPDPSMDRRPATAILKAPAAGVITRSTAAVGATASPMQPEPLFRIAVDDEIELEADVPSIHIPMLAPGQAARVEIENSRELSGKVRLVPGSVDLRTQLGRARISLERDPRLRVGMFARATIEANRSRGISVPHSAVLYRTEGPSVQVVRGDAVETRLVHVGYHSDTDTEILDGLSEGDLVVANAGSSLRDGDKVKPIETDLSRMGLR